MKKPKNWEGIKWNLVGAPVRPSECTVNLLEIVEYAATLEKAFGEATHLVRSCLAELDGSAFRDCLTGGTKCPHCQWLKKWGRDEKA